MATLQLLPGGAVPARHRPAPATAGQRTAGRRPGAERRPMAHRSVPVAAPPVPPRPMPTRAAPAPLRLTRRGRVVVRLLGLVVLAAVVSAGVLLLVRPAMAGTTVHPVSVRYHVVLPGETLLQIAAEEVPGVDVRDTAARIIELNALPGSGVDAGQRLALPVGS